ncbi:CHAT domain-containing protein [Bradyrhizobium oligotrophicum]|nr:CHAT domain-containing protein [Bradyrhizobium oligotrophicum]
MRIDAQLKAGDEQQAQNELDHLARYGLIRREDNNGQVKDGSKYLYSKDSNVRAHRKMIVKFADNPKLAAAIPTKRRPAVKVSNVKTVTVRALKKLKRLNVLYLTANPDEQNSLRIDAEVRQVQEAVRGSKLRDNIELLYRPAADLDSLVDGLNDYAPGIVHFSGHGYSGGLAVDHAKVTRPKRRILTFEHLGKAFAAVDTPPRVVVLNACESAGAEKALLPLVSAIIVMRDSVSDIAATALATRFYAAIAAGQSLKSAFKQGVLAVEHASINEADIPQLITAPGVNSATFYLV